MPVHVSLASSLDFAFTTSSSSVIIPRTLIAVRKDMEDRLVLVNRPRVDRRHSSMDFETSVNFVDELRLWNTLKMVAAGEVFKGETGMSHCRRLVADCSILSKDVDVSAEYPSIGDIELAIPWRLVELRAFKTPYLLALSDICISLSNCAL